MRNGKKIFFLTEAILGILVLCMAFLMIREKNGQQTVKVSVILQNAEDSQWAAFRYGLKMAAMDQNIDVFVAATEGALSAEEQYETMEQEIAYGADAVIVQPAAHSGEYLKKARKKVPVILLEEPEPDVFQGDSVVQADSFEMGETLARELLSDYEGNLSGKKIGILMDDSESEASMQRKEGLIDTLKDTGAEIVWCESADAVGDGKETLEQLPEVDCLLGTGDRALTTAGEAASGSELHGALVYGIGNSTEAVYYLDTGIVECLVVPDDFQTGYHSLSEAVRMVRNRFYRGEDHSISWKTLRREELFLEENQDLLFTMCQ